MLFLASVWPASSLCVTLQYISPQVPSGGALTYTGYTYLLQGDTVYYCSAKSLFVILYCVQRGNLDEFISDHDLGDVSNSASSTLYLTLKTAIILSPFVFHSALI